MCRGVPTLVRLLCESTLNTILQRPAYPINRLRDGCRGTSQPLTNRLHGFAVVATFDQISLSRGEILQARAKCAAAIFVPLCPRLAQVGEQVQQIIVEDDLAPLIPFATCENEVEGSGARPSAEIRSGRVFILMTQQLEIRFLEQFLGQLSIGGQRHNESVERSLGVDRVLNELFVGSCVSHCCRFSTKAGTHRFDVVAALSACDRRGPTSADHRHQVVRAQADEISTRNLPRRLHFVANGALPHWISARNHLLCEDLHRLWPPGLPKERACIFLVGSPGWRGRGAGDEGSDGLLSPYPEPYHKKTPRRSAGLMKGLVQVSAKPRSAC